MFSNSAKESVQLRLHFSAPLLNSGVVLSNGKFNTIFAVILMAFYSAFITSIITLKLINFRKVRIVVLPGLHDLIKWHLLVSRGHIVRRRCGFGGQ